MTTIPHHVTTPASHKVTTRLFPTAPARTQALTNHYTSTTYFVTHNTSSLPPNPVTFTASTPPPHPVTYTHQAATTPPQSGCNKVALFMDIALDKNVGTVKSHHCADNIHFDADAIVTAFCGAPDSSMWLKGRNVSVHRNRFFFFFFLFIFFLKIRLKI